MPRTSNSVPHDFKAEIAMPHRLSSAVDLISIKIMGIGLLASWFDFETLKNLSIVIGIVYNTAKFGEWCYKRYSIYKRKNQK